MVQYTGLRNTQYHFPGTLARVNKWHSFSTETGSAQDAQLITLLGGAAAARGRPAPLLLARRDGAKCQRSSHGEESS